MRNAFIKTLVQLAVEDNRIWLVSGDLGYSVLEPFSERFPERFVNAGASEQNMTGLAAGLAMTGKTVFTYSIANFPIMRCLEQIRNDICYHNQNVKIVAVGGGLAYGSQGYTHHAVEDLAVMRVLPNMTVIAPGDPVETVLSVQAVVEHMGPCYLRLGKSNEPLVHEKIPTFKIGKSIPLFIGKDLTIICTGGMLKTAFDAVQGLFKKGISATFLSMPTIQPIDCDSILESAEKTKRIMTVEEHGIGGLGSAVAEVLAHSGLSYQFRTLNLSREPSKVAGSQDYLLQINGLTVKSIMEKVEHWISISI